MKSILIIGLGRFGRHVVTKMNELGNHIMAVDCKAERVQAVLPYVTNALIGDSTDTDFLRSLGIRNFDVCIVGIGDSFQDSLETTYLLKELGASHVIARASRDRHAKFLLHNGADEVVYPERQMANWIAMKSSADHILDFIEVTEDYGIFEIEVPPEWLGKTILELDIRKRHHMNIMAVKHNQQLNMEIIPSTRFSDGDAALVLGKSKEVYKLIGKINRR